MNFPTLNTYEAQIIVLMNYYDYNIIELVKKHKKVLRKNNFDSNFFLKIKNRCPYTFKQHIKELASTQIANWYRDIKRKQCMKKFISLKKINPYVDIDLKDYFYKNDFDLFGLEEDLNILFHLYHGGNDMIDADFTSDEEISIEALRQQGDDYSLDFDSDSSIDYPYEFEENLEPEFNKPFNETFNDALNGQLPEVLINKHITDLEEIWDEEYSLDFDSDTNSEEIPETPKETEQVPDAVPEEVHEEVPEPETPKEPEEDLEEDKKEEENQVEDNVKKNIGYYEWFKSFFY